MAGTVLGALLDLVLPRSCAACGTPGADVCPGCRGALALAAAQPLGRTRPDPTPRGFPVTCAAAPYDGAVRDALLAFKEHGRAGLTEPLGAALAAAVLALGTHGRVCLVPVPSRPQAVRSRGHDFATALSRSAAEQLRARGVPATAARALRPGRALRDQAGLDRDERAANLLGALVVQRPPDAPVVVVDDVVTTGATLVEAVRALASAGAEVRGAAVVAATARQRDRGATRSGLSRPRFPV